MMYEIEEPILNKKEMQDKEQLVTAMRNMINFQHVVDKDYSKLLEYIDKRFKILAIELGMDMSYESYRKIYYYLARDFIGFNETEPLLRDYFVEDIECNGAGTPVYIVHRVFRNLRTNLTYNDIDELTGLTHFTKNYNCPSGSSPCLPTDNQIALYDSKDYLGDCMLLDIGTYNQATITSQLGNDQTTSIKVGKNVQATLFSDDGLISRGETFITDDSNLSDNRIGKNSTSSVKVEARNTTPAVPSLIYPANNTTFSTDSSFSLAWENKGTGLEFKAQILKNGSEVNSTDWQETTFWHINSLGSGEYSWKVKARNGEKESNWSAASNFNIEDISQVSPSSVSVPFTDTMESGENGWTFSANWSQVSVANHTTNGTKSWRYHFAGQSSYNNGAPNSGYLTSPEIQIPASGEYYLRFWYQYETEDDGLNWDQRWVQIAVNGEPFTNMQQLSDDAPNYWLKSKPISLASYASKAIRVRFYFATLDQVFNDFKG